MATIRLSWAPRSPIHPGPTPYRPRHPGFSSSTAIPCPPPMHTAATPYLSPSARSWRARVMARRRPVAASGCPRAMAPPCTLSRAGSSSRACCTASSWAPWASLISRRSMASEASAVEQALDGRHRAAAHDVRRHPHHATAAHPGQCPSRCGVRAPCQQHGGGAVGHRAAVAGGLDAARMYRRQPRQGLPRGLPRMAVLLDHRAASR